ncbi:hypothetical protein AC579_505 [Pseudocercospora musae]|uniref:Uncharacterized protein n=1 Tax=Pseudocercospora musae TaxID=113226 RepID=A0A139I5W1_9PEZI|nr:hypothetical protein AC579_505 [Pseudocercospora musae]
MAAKMTASTASAASRTFAIPELLEHVLKCVASDGKYIQEHDRQPAIQLFALRRVSQNFNDAIVGSKAVQCRMHEAPSSYGRMSGRTHSMGWNTHTELGHPELEKIRRAILRAEMMGKKAESWEKIEYWPRAAENMVGGWIWWELGLIVVAAGEGRTFGDVLDIITREKHGALRERAGE